MASFSCVIGVVQADAQNLMGPGNRRTDASSGNGLHLPRSDAFVNKRPQANNPVGAEECFVEVLNDITDLNNDAVSVRIAVNQHARSFGPEGA